jgi:hypothetical protein
MAAPLAVMAGKYLLGEAMDRMGANKDLKGLVTAGPQGFLLGKLKGAVDDATGVMPGTTNLLTNPKGALLDAGRNYVKDKVQEAYNADDSPMSAVDSYDSPEMTFGEGEYKRGGKVKSKSTFKPQKASSASRRGDGIAQRGKTKGRYV